MANVEESTTTTTSTTQVILANDDDDILRESFTANSSSSCCSFFPCFGPRPSPAQCGSSSSPSVWKRLRQTAAAEGKWWAGPVSGLKKAREWSEIIAGPKWKTFIRRFNKIGSVKTTSVGSGKFQYDAFSYSLNFDEGRGYNGKLDDESGYFPDFSSRFASINSCKNSVDFG
ncbi:hypothetical protein RND81_13G127600 [Saponaria officinalis]|uniref:Uncharacterized protein n=1 Tax=Saponaria officinalis TaxID=3572 RepID=A0AAW1H599_SAPOF